MPNRPTDIVTPEMALVLRLGRGWYWRQDENCRFTFIQFGDPDNNVRLSGHLGKARWELPNLESKAFWDRHRETLKARKPYYQLEYQVTKFTEGAANPAWVRASGEPIFDATGQFCGYHGYPHEIEAHKRVRIAVIASERRFAALFDQSPVGMIEWDS